MQDETIWRHRLEELHDAELAKWSDGEGDVAQLARRTIRARKLLPAVQRVVDGWTLELGRRMWSSDPEVRERARKLAVEMVVEGVSRVVGINVDR